MDIIDKLTKDHTALTKEDCMEVALLCVMANLLLEQCMKQVKREENTPFQVLASMATAEIASIRIGLRTITVNTKTDVGIKVKTEIHDNAMDVLKEKAQEEN